MIHFCPLGDAGVAKTRIPECKSNSVCKGGIWENKFRGLSEVGGQITNSIVSRFPVSVEDAFPHFDAGCHLEREKKRSKPEVVSEYVELHIVVILIRDE